MPRKKKYRQEQTYRLGCETAQAKLDEKQ